MATKGSLIISADQIRKIRKDLDLNQGDFWSRLGVTQSGGSRYESGRPVPAPTMMLLRVAYGTEKQANTMIEHLRTGR